MCRIRLRKLRISPSHLPLEVIWVALVKLIPSGLLNDGVLVAQGVVAFASQMAEAGAAGDLTGGALDRLRVEPKRTGGFAGVRIADQIGTDSASSPAPWPISRSPCVLQ